MQPPKKQQEQPKPADYLNINPTEGRRLLDHLQSGGLPVMRRVRRIRFRFDAPPRPQFPEK